MVEFLKKDIQWNQFELLIDGTIFEPIIIMKAAYMFLNKGYFFFKKWTNTDIILQFTPKPDINTDPETIIGDYSDELLNTYLRDILEKDNRVIRETIVQSAISNAIDQKNFVSIDTESKQKPVNQIDFDKDIDEILREIENDPDLKIDEEEIEKILKEIEHKTQSEEKKSVVLDPKKVTDAKKKFQNRK
jgi:His-Xaa-Ser system protein HxsD